MKPSRGENIETSDRLLRIKSLLFDWLFISGYLILLFISISLFYFLRLNGIPTFTNAQSQLIAILTSVIPIILIFSLMEGRNLYASWGKRKTKLMVIYKDRPMIRSIVRNVLKFLPWQFGHMSTIYGLYNGFDSAFSIIFFSLSMSLSMVYILMAFIRRDRRHLVDILAGSRVVRN